MTTTMTCPACGQGNDRGVAFCGACGSYLDWDEAEPAPATAPPPATAAAPATAPPVDAAVPAATPAAASGPAAPATSAPVAPATGGPSATPGHDGPPASSTERVVAPVLPGAPAARRPSRAPDPEEAPPAPGDLICGSCGAGNVPTRHFCRRCGASLVEARVQGRRSWWRRLLRPDPRPDPVAGARPRRRRRFPTRAVVAVLVVGALGLAAYVSRDALGDGVTAVQDRLQGGTTFNPVSVAASSEAPDRPATQLVDGTSDLGWSPAAPGDGVGQTVDLAFDEPFRLVHLVVAGGTSPVQEEYLTGSSPRALDVTTTAADGSTRTQRVALDDVPGPQTLDVTADDVVAVRLTIVSTYRGAPETFVGLAEVELRGRS